MSACRLHKGSAHLCSNWLTRFRIVKICGDVKLQQLTEFTNDVLRGSVLILPPQLVVCLDNLCQLMSQIILRPVAFCQVTDVACLCRQSHKEAMLDVCVWLKTFSCASAVRKLMCD